MNMKIKNVTTDFEKEGRVLAKTNIKREQPITIHGRILPNGEVESWAEPSKPGETVAGNAIENAVSGEVSVVKKTRKRSNKKLTS